MKKHLAIVWLSRLTFLVQKELKILAGQWLLYVASAVFSSVCALHFFLAGRFFLPSRGSSDLNLFFSIIPYISILIIPFLTMGQWTSESLLFDLTLPVSEAQLVLAKWTSCVVVAALMLVPGLCVPFLVNQYGTVDLAQIVSGYVGIVFFQGTACALGILVAAVFNGKVPSFFVTALFLTVFCLVHLVPVYMENPSWLASLCRQLSFSWHFDGASKGIVDTRDLGFYSASTVFLIMAASESIRIKKRGSL